MDDQTPVISHQNLSLDRRWPASRVALICTALLLVSGLTRVVCFWQMRDNPITYQQRWDQSDMNFYDRWARDLAGGDWLQDKAVHPLHTWHRDMAHIYLSQHHDAVREITEQAVWDTWYGQKRFHQEPLYPYLIAAIYRFAGTDVRAVFAWQMVLGCATVVLIYLLARELMGEIPAVVAGILALGYGPLLYYEMLLLREATLVFASAAVMYFTVIAASRGSWRWWLIVGVTLGLGLLLKTTLSLFVASAVVAILAKERKNLRRAAVYVVAMFAGIVIALSPAIVRNLRVGVGPLELSSVGTITFVNANVADADNHQFGFFWSLALAPEIMGKSNGKFLPALRLTIQTYPNVVEFLKMIGNKLWWMCNWYENPDNANFYFYREMAPVLRLLPIGFLVVGSLAAIGIWAGLKSLSRWWPIYAMAATNVVVMLAFYPNSRMRIPLVPELILFAALAAAAISQWARTKRWLPLGLSAAVIVAAAVLILQPIPKDRSVIRSDDYLVSYMNYTLPEMKQAQAAGNLERAGYLLEGFLAHEPSQLDNLDAAHLTSNPTDQAIAQIFAAAHVREANLLGNTDNAEANLHMKRARDLMAAAGKPMPF